MGSKLQKVAMWPLFSTEEYLEVAESGEDTTSVIKKITLDRLILKRFPKGQRNFGGMGSHQKGDLYCPQGCDYDCLTLKVDAA